MSVFWGVWVRVAARVWHKASKLTSPALPLPLRLAAACHAPCRCCCRLPAVTRHPGLQQVYEKYQSHGLEVLAFPCNQFGGQEPGSDAEVAAFATGTYHTTFTL